MCVFLWQRTGWSKSYLKVNQGFRDKSLLHEAGHSSSDRLKDYGRKLFQFRLSGRRSEREWQAYESLSWLAGMYEFQTMMVDFRFHQPSF